MSIEDEIVDRVAQRRLFPLMPKAAGATVRRAMFIGEELQSQLNSPEGDEVWEERIGKLQADLEVFVTAESISARYLFLLFRKEDGVWEIRSTRDAPSIRVLGRFPLKDTFVSTNFALREKLGGWQSREWKTIKRLAKAIWRQLFPTYQPIITADAMEICSGATNELFYKERA